MSNSLYPIRAIRSKPITVGYKFDFPGDVLPAAVPFGHGYFFKDGWHKKLDRDAYPQLFQACQRIQTLYASPDSSGPVHVDSVFHMADGLSQIQVAFVGNVDVPAARFKIAGIIRECFGLNDCEIEIL